VSSRETLRSFPCAPYLRSERDGLIQGRRASQPVAAAAALAAADVQAADAKPGPLSSLERARG
jgi:hypothetical protein